ncbi:MAG: hypothetical protein IKM10_02950 [Bacteroidaceae bacterium]|nr:hypothetical protein [Bacteroidaceae bacterium]
MDSEEELEIKNKVQIFLSEKDINCEYNIISHNLYHPFCIPIFMSQKNEISKKFYENAVKQAYKLGGNGVIITSVNTYKVINLNQKDGNKKASNGYLNLILDTTLMDKFNNGIVAQLSPQEIKIHINELKSEIEFNVKSVKTLDEVRIIEKKIDALQAYNNSQPLFDKELDLFLAKNRKELYLRAMKVSTDKEVILNTSLMEKFNNGDVSQLKTKQVERCVEEFFAEIIFNIKNVRTSNELITINKKIDALQIWNNAQREPNLKLNQALEKLKESTNRNKNKVIKEERIYTLKKEIELGIKSAKTSDDIRIVEDKLKSLQTYNKSQEPFDIELDKFYNKNQHKLSERAREINIKEHKIENNTLINNINNYKEEIELDIIIANTLEETLIIDKKLDALLLYNNSLNKYNKDIEKFYKENRKTLIVKAQSFAQKEGTMLNTALIDKFSDGSIDKLTQKLIDFSIEEMQNEIEFNFETIKTSEEATILGRKINILQGWNTSQAFPNEKLKENILKYRKKISRFIKRLDK